MPYRTSPETQLRKEEMRGAILAAARRLFVLHGYEATTMQQIVQEAGTSIGNLYFYFRNKEQVLAALAAQITTEIAETMDAAIARAPVGVPQLAVAMYTSVTTLLMQADIAQLVLAESARPLLRLEAMAFFTARIRYFFTMHPALVGELNPDLAARAWQGAIFYVLESVLSGQIEESADTVGRFLVRWNLQALTIPAADIEAALAAIDDSVR